MSKILLVAAALLFAFAAVGPAVGQATPSAECSDDRGVDRCAEAQQRRVRELYGVPPIEAHRDAGDQVRRVFYVDGSGRDLVLVAFLRSPGRDPVVQVHFPQRSGQARAAPLEALVPQPVWDEVILRSMHFERSYERRPDEPPAVCLHSWVYTVESVDRAQGRLPAEVRRKTEDACEDGPAGSYAMEVPRLALALFPACAALDPTQYRNSATMLVTCRLLRGDRLAAAEALNLAGAFRQFDGPEDAGLLRGRFDYRGAVDWNGARNSGDGTATNFWVERIVADGSSNLFVEAVNGETADRVLLTGFLSRSVQSADRESRYQEARVEQIWARDINGDLKVQRATVRPWRRRHDR